MKTFDLGPHDPPALSAQLKAAGIPVSTIKSAFMEKRATTASYGVLFTEDSADNLSVQAVITAHTPKDPTPATKPPAEKQASMDAMKGIVAPEPVVDDQGPGGEPVVIPDPEPPAPIFCNVCGLEITEPSEQIDRIYVVVRSGKKLPVQKKHDACALQYESKLGLARQYLKDGETELPPIPTLAEVLAAKAERDGKAIRG